MTRISALICTHNRAAYLRHALQSLAGQTLSPADYEVIVVDNASTDETPPIVQSFAAGLSNVRYVREDRLGLSWARNTGAAAAFAPYVAYLDDDARAEPEWLEKLLEAFETVQPAPVAVGGRVWLDWGSGVPSWLPRRYWPLYTYLDHGQQGHFLGEKEYLVGANMAFRRDVLLELGGFDPRLGRRGTTLLSGEEAALFQRIQESAMPVYYAPQAIVWHAVPEVRRHRRWLWSRLFWDGASQPLLDYGTTRSRRFYAFQAYYDLRRLAFFSLQWLRALAASDKEQCLESALNVVQRMGRLRTNLWLTAKGSL